MSVCVTQKFNFIVSKKIISKSCHISFSDDKNAFGVNPQVPGALRGAPGGHSKSWSNEKMLLICISCQVCFSDENKTKGTLVHERG